MPSSFRRADLLAEGGAYSSVDDDNMLSKLSIDWRIAWQQREGRAEREGRHQALFATLNAGDVRRCSIADDSRQLFDVTRKPTVANEDGPGSPANPAHCGVETLQPERFGGMTRGEKSVAVEKMRIQLIKIVISVRGYDDLFETDK